MKISLCLLSGVLAGQPHYQLSQELGAGSNTISWNAEDFDGADTYRISYQSVDDERHTLGAMQTDTTTTTEYTINEAVGTVFNDIVVEGIDSASGNITASYNTNQARVGGAAAYFTDSNQAANGTFIFEGRLMTDGLACASQIDITFDLCDPIEVNVWGGNELSYTSSIGTTGGSLTVGQSNIKAYAKIQAIFNLTDTCHSDNGRTDADIMAGGMTIQATTLTNVQAVTIPMNVTQLTMIPDFPDESRPNIDWQGNTRVDDDGNTLYLNNATFVAYSATIMNLDGNMACTASVDVNFDAGCALNAGAEVVGLTDDALVGGSISADMSHFDQDTVTIVGSFTGDSIHGVGGAAATCDASNMDPVVTMTYNKLV